MPSVHKSLRNMTIRQLALHPKGNGIEFKLTCVGSGEFDASKGQVKKSARVYTGSGVRVNYSEFTHRNANIPYSEFQIYVSPIHSGVVEVYPELNNDGSITGLTPVEEQDISDLPRPKAGDTFLMNGVVSKVIESNPFNDNVDGCGYKVRVKVG